MSTDVHSLSGAYALDALTPEEAAEFRLHLEGCAVCRQEVAELREVAALMGAAEADRPPAALRDRVLAAADRTPQVPPRVASGSTVRSLDSAPSRRRRLLAGLASAAAAVLIGAVGVGVLVNDDEDSGLSAAAAQVFEADDAQVATFETTEGGRLEVAVSPGLNEMAVDTSGLPALDDEHVYQLWAVQDGRMTSAGVVRNPDAGAAMNMPPANTSVAVTVEPTGGSEQPTGPPIVQVDPSALA